MSSTFQNYGRNLKEVLESDYPDISEAIKREGYNLDFPDFDIFNEIIYENRPVGFITFSQMDICENYFAITEAYVIPEFRGNNLLFDNLVQFLFFDNFEYFPVKPTKAFIKVLLKNDYAFELAPGFVVSYLKFMVGKEDLYRNPKIKRFYKNGFVVIPYKANLFDMDLCSVMFVDPLLEVVRYSDFFALSEPRKYDLKKYGCRKKLKKVTEKYIDEKYSLWEVNFSEIEKFQKRKDDEFREMMELDTMVGSEDELTDDFKDVLAQCALSEVDGFEIRKHVADKLESGNLTVSSAAQRIRYLLDHFEDIDRQTSEADEETCPFCGNYVPDFARSCVICGQTIREIDFDEHAVRKLKDEFDEFLKAVKDSGLGDFLNDEDN